MCYCLWLGSGICPPRTIPLGPKFLYSFRDPKAASEQEIGYVQNANKKDNFKAESYVERKGLFG
ncbi:hypothetical protein, partial [Prevotella lacticifex]